jgi:hypothetical protein
MPPVDAFPEATHMNDTRPGEPSGCLSLLGGPLLAFGLWMIAQALLLPHEAEAIRLSIITGAFAVLLGGWLLAARMRRVFARRGATPAPASGTPPAPADGEPDRGEVTTLEPLSGGAGCFIISLGFLLAGPILLWFYFSGAPTTRGNPVMGLAAGILFSALGFLGILALGSMRRKSGRRWGRNDPRRLP